MLFCLLLLLSAAYTLIWYIYIEIEIIIRKSFSPQTPASHIDVLPSATQTKPNTLHNNQICFAIKPCNNYYFRWKSEKFIITELIGILWRWRMKQTQFCSCDPEPCGFAIGLVGSRLWNYWKYVNMLHSIVTRLPESNIYYNIEMTFRYTFGKVPVWIRTRCASDLFHFEFINVYSKLCLSKWILPINNLKMFWFTMTMTFVSTAW